VRPEGRVRRPGAETVSGASRGGRVPSNELGELGAVRAGRGGFERIYVAPSASEHKAINTRHDTTHVRR
jgi:hypothetical protein